MAEHPHRPLLRQPLRTARMAVCLVSPLWASVGWRNDPGDRNRSTDLAFYRDLARLAERGRFDLILQPDKYIIQGTSPETFQTSVSSWPEPITLASALAAVTEHIGFSVTLSTTYNEPFHVARIIASLDHLSGGRASWNVVTSRELVEDHNFRNDHRAHGADRGIQSQEFVDVVKALWDSWDDDAIVYDKARGIHADPAKVRRIDHEGAWHTVQGPLNVARPPQGHPVLVTAGLSENFRERAATMADAIFTNLPTLEEGVAFTSDVRRRLVAHGRGEGDLLVLPNFTFISGETEAEARRRLDAFAESGAMIAGQIHKTGLVGSPSQIADHIERWWEAGACDGFTYLPIDMPRDLELWADLIAPELQRRGVLPETYEGTTLREHLGLPRPANRFTLAGV